MKGPLCAGPVTGKLHSITEARAQELKAGMGAPVPSPGFLLFSPHPHPEKKQMFGAGGREQSLVQRPPPGFGELGEGQTKL